MYSPRVDWISWPQRPIAFLARRPSRSVASRSLLLGLMLLPWITAPVFGQLPDEAETEGGTPFIATIQDLTERSQRVSIALNQSVLIDLSKPAVRVQAIEPEVAFVQTVSPTQFLLTGAGTGTTQVIAWSEDEQQRIFYTTVELDLTNLNTAIDTLDPLSNVEASAFMGNVVLSGTASSTEMAERFVALSQMFMPESGTSTTGGSVTNHMTIAGEQQVLLRVTVGEVSRTAARQLGINGFLAGDNFRDAFVVNQVGGVNPANIGVTQMPNVRSNAIFGAVDSTIPLSPSVPLSLGFPRVQMQLFLDALATNSLFRVLAEPNIVAISGETASFLVGGEFPIPVPQGIDQITIEYREFGARLFFTPVVRAGERIRLHVAPELSELDFSEGVQIAGTTVPGLNTRRWESTVEVGNGQTLALAGLLNVAVRGIVSRVPGIGDVPVLGALFRSVEYQRQITELVVLVTPEIVSPLNPDQVPPVPGAEFTDPSDFELYAMGLLEHDPSDDENIDLMNPDGSRDEAMTGSKPEQMSLHGPWGHSVASDYR